MNGHGRWLPEGTGETRERDSDLLSLVDDEPDLRRLLTAVVDGGDTEGLVVWGIAAVLERKDRALVTAPSSSASRGHGPLVMLLLERDQLNVPGADHSGHGAPSPVAGRDANRFARDGEVWELTFAGETVRLKDTKGLRDIARLLRNPDREVHCLELMGSPVNECDMGPVIDGAARRAYQRRRRELQADLDDAEAAHDLARADSARDELEWLIDQLTAATGLGGRPRRTGASAERARSAVRWRISAAMRRIATAHPVLGRHLERSIRTGTCCVYQPADPVAWRLSERSKQLGGATSRA